MKELFETIIDHEDFLKHINNEYNLRVVKWEHIPNSGRIGERKLTLFEKMNYCFKNGCSNPFILSSFFINESFIVKHLDFI